MVYISPYILKDYMAKATNNTYEIQLTGLISC